MKKDIFDVLWFGMCLIIFLIALVIASGIDLLK